MTTARPIKAKKGKIESDIEKMRAEGSWNKAVELISLHKSDSALSYLYHLVMAESKLEHFETGYLDNDDLESASVFLSEAVKSPDDQYKLEASILSAKTLYLRKSFTAAQSLLKKLQLLSVKIELFATRYVRLISEGLALIGLCVEELAQMTRRELTVEELKEAQSHYEVCGEMCIRHFQELYQGALEQINVTFPNVVFKAIQRSLALTHQSGNIPATVEKFRYLLRFVETPSTRSLRQFLSCQFAELLLRGLTNNTFHKYDMGPEKTPIIHTRGWVSPQRYPAHRFIPDSLMREAVLMLLISEHIASQEVILNRPSEVSDARFMHSFNNTSAVYDLLAIALARTGNFVFLSRTLEKSLKFSYREFHIWYQFALSLISARKYYRAYLVLRECLRLDSSKLAVYFLASSLCLGHLGFIEDGFELATQAVEVASALNDPIMSARAHLILGWCFSLLARGCLVMDKKRDLQSQAVNEYKMATQLDAEDYLAWYHLAVELATQRQIDDALVACQRSLQLMPSHSSTLCLFVLLHTAGGKHMEQASKILRIGLSDRPNDINLLLLLAKVETVRQNAKVGLFVYRRLLEVWRDTFAPESDSSFLNRMAGAADSYTVNEDFALPTSVPAPTGFDMEEEATIPALQSETNYLSVALTDIAHGLVGQIGSSIPPVMRSTRSTAHTLSPSIRLQAKIYQGLAELYMDNGQLNEAKDALDEAARITSLDVETLFLRGCLTEKQGSLAKARSMYESVISIQPTHLQALLCLANLLRQTDQATLAERVIRDAIAVDQTSCRVWHLLAEILRAPSTSEPASDMAVTRALLNAVELEQTEPLQPFYEMPIGVLCS
ncbi:Tetratricopeptide repeat protein 7B [Fasciola hepatica]|uniref:Tetratricopeptide repeat protein 7B n=1 Tax=Fasciola hepatica TaxID=6192 RepID=A0A4E0S0H7_FASHE|nr:Tetratricopeptide repeat protein 7B [Fasciola hepatica]